MLFAKRLFKKDREGVVQTNRINTIAASSTQLWFRLELTNRFELKCIDGVEGVILL